MKVEFFMLRADKSMGIVKDTFYACVVKRDENDPVSLALYPFRVSLSYYESSKFDWYCGCRAVKRPEHGYMLEKLLHAYAESWVYESALLRDTVRPPPQLKAG